MRIFISQPMKGKTDSEIKQERERIIEKVREEYGEAVTVIESFFEGAPAAAKPLWFLGKSLEMLAGADLAVFASGVGSSTTAPLPTASERWKCRRLHTMDISSLGITGVAAITVICLLIGQAVKATRLDNKWIPIICGVCGMALGIAAMYIMPEFPATDYITAAAVGIVSGLAATGINQAAKQIGGK